MTAANSPRSNHRVFSFYRHLGFSALFDKMASSQQITAAQNIQAVFLQGMRYALLMAQCQSGKTGSFQELIRLMLSTGAIQRAYILCGSSELELRSQAIDDTKKANGSAYTRGDVKVLFRQDFKGAMMDITNAIIVVDESHLDQSSTQELSKFLAAHGLSMDGNPAKLNEKNAFIISVDATPYAEIASLVHKETPFEKHIEMLVPGKSYYGLSDYRFDSRLSSTFNIDAEPSRFKRLLDSVPKKFVLIRLTRSKNNDAQERMIRRLCYLKNLKVLSYTAEETEIAITREQQKEMGSATPCLEDEPPVTTVVIVRGRLRAGKVVPKKHIGFVWEGAANSATDALVQGLPGRMCGYEFGAIKPLIFMPSAALKTYENKVLKASEIDRAIMGHPIVLPMKGTNLKKSHVSAAATNGSTECPPLRLTWDDTEDDWSFTDKFETKYRSGADRLYIGRRCHEILSKNLHLIRDSPNYSAEQKEEILEQIIQADLGAPHSFALRHLEGESQSNWFKKMLTAHQTGTATGELIDECRPLNFVVTYRGYKGAHANPRHLYVVFYTKANGGGGGIMAVNLKSRIPATNGKSHFTPQAGATDVPLVAGGVVGFDESKLKTPATLEKSLRDYLSLYRTSELTVARQIQSNKERFSLDKKAFNYKNSKENDVEAVCKKLSTEFSVKLAVKYSRSSAGEGGHFNVKTITW